MALVNRGEWIDETHFLGYSEASVLNPFLSSGKLPGWLSVELAAQSSAVHSAVSADQEKKQMKHGYLVGVSQWEHHAVDYAGEVILSEIEIRSTLGPLILVHARVILGDVCIAEGSLKFHVEFKSYE